MGSFEGFIGVDFWTALFVLLNTLAIFFVAKKYLFKPVHKLISDRQSEIDNLYAEAEKRKRDADNAAKALEEKLTDARRESDRIVSEAVKKAETREQEIVARAKSEAQAVLEKAAQDAEQEKKQALNEAKNEISSLAMTIAEKVVGRQLDESDDSRLVDDFIDGLGKQP